MSSKVAGQYSSPPATNSFGHMAYFFNYSNARYLIFREDSETSSGTHDCERARTAGRRIYPQPPDLWADIVDGRLLAAEGPQ